MNIKKTPTYNQLISIKLQDYSPFGINVICQKCSSRRSQNSIIKIPSLNNQHVKAV